MGRRKEKKRKEQEEERNKEVAGKPEVNVTAGGQTPDIAQVGANCGPGPICGPLGF